MNSQDFTVPPCDEFMSVGRVGIVPQFPFEMAFAMTIHKAQGRTIPRVVLALSEHVNPYSRMNFSSIFVALSRVKHRDHLRIFIHGTSKRSFKTELEYLTKLKPEKCVIDYYSGFPENQCGIWNPQLALKKSLERKEHTRKENIATKTTCKQQHPCNSPKLNPYRRMQSSKLQTRATKADTTIPNKIHIQATHDSSNTKIPSNTKSTIEQKPKRRKISQNYSRQHMMPGFNSPIIPEEIHDNNFNPTYNQIRGEGSISITEGDWVTLQPDGWTSNFIIYNYFRLELGFIPNVILLPPGFHTTWESSGWISPQNLTPGSVLVLPLFTSTAPAHWTLLIIDSRKNPFRDFIYVNSLYDPGEARKNALIALLQRTPNIVQPNSTFQHPKSPRQHNVDCGIWVCMQGYLLATSNIPKEIGKLNYILTWMLNTLASWQGDTFQ